jgi:hypothetical protein
MEPSAPVAEAKSPEATSKSSSEPGKVESNKGGEQQKQTSEVRIIKTVISYVMLTEFVFKRK